jgi:hypothetical protein
MYSSQQEMRNVVSETIRKPIAERRQAMVNRKDSLAAIATCFQVPVSTLDAHDREMVKAGVRPHSHRGQNPPPMTAQDVIHMTFAATGKRSVKSAAEEVAEIAGLALRGGIRELRDLDPLTQDLVYTQDGDTLTPDGILNGATLQFYPRNQVPMGSTFGESLANVIERTPVTVVLEDLSATVRWPPMSAEIRFRLEKFRYRLFFGAVDVGKAVGVTYRVQRKAPIYSFEYQRDLLEWLGEIYRS